MRGDDGRGHEAGAEMSQWLPASKWPLEADSISFYSNDGLTCLGSVSRATAEAMERDEIGESILKKAPPVPTIGEELEQMKRAADRYLAALWIGFLCVVTILLLTLG